MDINIRTLLSGARPDQNIVVRPHDIVAVTKAEVVFVIGEVGRPGPIPLDGNSMSAMEAVAAAGGVLRSASSAKARILREKPGTATRVEMDLDLKKIMRGESADVPLAAGDILTVPEAVRRHVLARALEIGATAAISIGTVLLVRR